MWRIKLYLEGKFQNNIQPLRKYQQKYNKNNINEDTSSNKSWKNCLQINESLQENYRLLLSRDKRLKI